MNSLVTKSKFVLEIHKSAFQSFNFVNSLRRITSVHKLNINNSDDSIISIGPEIAQCLRYSTSSLPLNVSQKFSAITSLENVGHLHTTCALHGSKKWQKVRA